MFYENLFKKNVNTDCENENFQYFFNNASNPKLTPEQKSELDTEITLREIEEVLKTFKNNKSPGEDGLTKEFYVKFWDDLKLKHFECCLLYTSPSPRDS